MAPVSSELPTAGWLRAFAMPLIVWFREDPQDIVKDPLYFRCKAGYHRPSPETIIGRGPYFAEAQAG
jgi:hypothetical protein